MEKNSFVVLPFTPPENTLQQFVMNEEFNSLFDPESRPVVMISADSTTNLGLSCKLSGSLLKVLN